MPIAQSARPCLPLTLDFARTAQRKPILDLTKLAGQPIATVERRLGKPITIDEITDDPREMPGDYREYRVRGFKSVSETEAGFTVQYYNGNAVSFIIELETPTETAEEALMQVGIDVRGKAADRSAMLASIWSNLTVGGANFKDIGAQTGLNGGRFVRVIANLSRRP